jgi:UDP-glucose 4-epimerase
MRILLTGKNSYIGNSFKNFLLDKPDYKVDEISVRNRDWKTLSFKYYDVIIHLAALVHKNEKRFSLKQYAEVNVDLTLDIAKKAIEEGVSHFIFFSTMAVFGKEKAINKDTPLKPISKYGITKLKAENLLNLLTKDSKMILTIIRPPMIYGVGAKGNPSYIEKLSSFTCIFPLTYNRRSFLSIDNLNTLMFEHIKNKQNTLIHPQDANYMTTFDLFKYYRSKNNKLSHPIKTIGKLLKKFLFIDFINKLFGDLFYDFYD